MKHNVDELWLSCRPNYNQLSSRGVLCSLCLGKPISQIDGSMGASELIVTCTSDQLQVSFQIFRYQARDLLSSRVVFVAPHCRCQVVATRLLSTQLKGS
jgi:hypothetical protein